MALNGGGREASLVVSDLRSETKESPIESGS